MKIGWQQQSYCKNYQAYFFWPNLYTLHIYTIIYTHTTSVRIHSSGPIHERS